MYFLRLHVYSVHYTLYSVPYTVGITQSKLAVTGYTGDHSEIHYITQYYYIAITATTITIDTDVTTGPQYSDSRPKYKRFPWRCTRRPSGCSRRTVPRSSRTCSPWTTVVLRNPGPGYREPGSRRCDPLRRCPW